MSIWQQHVRCQRHAEIAKREGGLHLREALIGLASGNTRYELDKVATAGSDVFEVRRARQEVQQVANLFRETCQTRTPAPSQEARVICGSYAHQCPVTSTRTRTIVSPALVDRNESIASRRTRWNSMNAPIA